MANITNKSKLQNTIPKIIWLSFGARKERIDRTILKKGPKNDLDPKDDAYETFVFIYNKE